MNNISNKYPDILALQSQLKEIDNKLKFDHYLIEEGSVRGIIKNMKRQISDLITSITDSDNKVKIPTGIEEAKLMVLWGMWFLKEHSPESITTITNKEGK